MAPDSLRLANARLAAIVESSDDAIISKTLDGVITSWNRAAERIFGYTAAEAVGKHITSIIPPDRIGEETEVLARLRRGDKIDHFETVRRTKDGRLVDISLTVSPIRDASGTVVGASKVARDITERKRIELERQSWLEREQRARAEAEKALQTRDEFLATVSHELRSPLNAITGWVHLLQAGTLDEDHTRRAINTIARNADMQSQLISDILDVQKLTSGRVRLGIAAMDLALAVEAAVDAIRPAAAHKGITLKLPSTSVHPQISGDPDRVQQMIRNLLSNAVKFTPKDGTVEVRLKDDGDQVELEVRDTGPGITPEFMPHLFERFRQDTSQGLGPGGLGLGLAIVKQLVELHGGSIRARNNRDGPGASFRVSLPSLARRRVDAFSSDAEDADPVQPRVAITRLLRNVRVLLVDDEPEAREVVAAVLGQYGADVSLAGSVDEALTLLTRVRPHVVVSDISIPHRDGYALVRAIRGLPADQGGQTPAVALSAVVGIDDRPRIERAGFQVHLTKPADPAELVQAIARLARMR